MAVQEELHKIYDLGVVNGYNLATKYIIGEAIDFSDKGKSGEVLLLMRIASALRAKRNDYRNWHIEGETDGGQS